MNDLVSVIIGTYERYDLLQKAINSVLNQTYKNIELIIVDDCSSDERYKSLIDSKEFKFIQLEKNSGLPAVPRNVGIKLSKGKWICFLDDDDYFLPNKIENQVLLSSKYDFICSEALCGYNNQKYAKGFYLNHWNSVNKEDTNHFEIDLIKKSNLIINSSVFVKKELLEEVGYIIEDKKYRRVEDYHTWLKILQITKKCFFIEEPLLYYNIYSEKK